MTLFSKSISRRKFLAGAALLSAPIVAVGADAKWVEPEWLQVQRLRLGGAPVGKRLVHFSDLHHKGDVAYLNAVVTRVNSLQPDLVCFTGDLIEESQFLPATLAALSHIQAPMYGVPGNHDYWSRISFTPVRQCFAATGGAWLMNQSQLTADGKIHFIGLAGLHAHGPVPASHPGAKNILLIHYPAWANHLDGRKFDLLLAGHSHGGQVRIPFYGPLIVPSHVEGYDLGLFQTPAGPLYVNAGIGYLGDLDFRFNCRPEITVFEI